MSTLSLVRVAAWSPERVSSWIKGLDSTVAEYAENFVASDVSGGHLVFLTNDDLDRMGIKKVGHQELLLQSIALLQTLDYELERETLLSTALQLSCRSHNLNNVLKALASKALSVMSQTAQHSELRRQYISILSGVSYTVGAIKRIASLIDRIPFETNRDRYDESRKQLIGFGLRLLSLSQDEQLLHNASSQENMMSLCRHIYELCDYLITESVDPLVIQPSLLELVTLHKKPEEELGIDLKVSCNGTHTIGRITAGSNASSCKKIELGDEVVYVNGHTVVGWPQRNVVAAFKENTKDVSMILAKRPCHMVFTGFQKKQQPHKELPKLNIGPKLSRSYGRKSRKNTSGTSGNSIGSVLDHLVDENLSDNDVFTSATPSPSVLHAAGIEPKLRRATVTCASPRLTRAALSANDLPSCVSELKARPKSYFPRSANGGVPDWRPVTPEAIRRQIAAVCDDNDSATKDDNDVAVVASSSAATAVTVLSPISQTSDALSHLHVDSQVLMSPLRKQSEMMAAPEIGDWSEQEGASTPLLTGMVRINSQRRAEMAEKERKASIDSLDSDRQISSTSQKASMSSILSNQTSTNLLRKKNFLHKVIGVNRRISCKDLGGGDCQGWLWKKKEGNTLRSGRWAKFWFVLQNKNLFYYKDLEDAKAQGVIHMNGFRVSPAESRSKKFAFKVFNSEVTFFLASERQDDMSKWMNKIGLATLQDYPPMQFHRPVGYTKSSDKDPTAVGYYSESDDETLSQNSHTVSAHDDTLSHSSVSTASSCEDLTDMYRRIRQADLTLSGHSFKAKRTSILHMASVGFKDKNAEKCGQLICLKRILKDKEQMFEAIEGLLHTDGSVTSAKLQSFCQCYPNMLVDVHLPAGRVVSSDGSGSEHKVADHA